MSSVFGGNEAELIAEGSLGQLRRAPEGVAGEKPHEGIVMIATLQSIERELRRIRSFTPEYGRQFTRTDGGQPAGTTMQFTLEGPKSGADWYMERLVVTVNAIVGAGAIVSAYVGNLVDESQIIDFLPIAAPAAAPSRATLDGHGGAPYFVYGGAPVTVLVAGIVAGNPTTVRLQGREVLSGADPALRAQADY